MFFSSSVKCARFVYIVWHEFMHQRKFLLCERIFQQWCNLWIVQSSDSVKMILTCLRIDVFRPNDDSNEVEVWGSSTIDTGLLSLYYNFSYFVSLILNHCQICLKMPLFYRDLWSSGIDLHWAKSAKLKILNDKTFDSHLSDLFRRRHTSQTLTYPVFAVTVALPQLVEAVAARVGCMRGNRSHALRRHHFIIRGRAHRRLILCHTGFHCSSFRDCNVLLLTALALWRGNSKFLQLLLERSTYRLLKKGYSYSSEWKG